MNHHHDPPQPRRDPHRVLGVAPDATRTQINAAYRRALRRLHPDTSGHTGQDTGGTTTPGHVTGPELTLADLQHARRELLRAARHTAEHPFGQAPGHAPRAVPVRRYRPSAGQPDIIAGPVRHRPTSPPD